MRIRHLAWGAVLFTLACQAPPAEITDADRDAVRASLETFTAAITDRDWDVIAAAYTEDAILMPPNMPTIIGVAAIREFWSGYPPATSVHTEMVEIEGIGDLMYSRGTYHVVFDAEGSPEESGKFLEIRRRQADGTWLITHDIFNADAPMAEGEGM